MSYREIKESVEKLQRIIDDGYAGTRDENSLNLIKREIAVLLSNPKLSARATAKLPELETWTDIYFSPRKHSRYRGGLDQVYQWMMEALNSARYSVPPDE